jgi:hypothetical protein
MRYLSSSKTSRILSILVLFTLLSGVFAIAPIANAKSTTTPLHHVQTPPSWLISLLKSHAADKKAQSTVRVATPDDVTLNQKVNIKDQNSGNLIYYSPSEIRSAYNSTGLLSSGVDGTGVTIAIVDAFGDPNIQGELNNFSAAFGIPTTVVHTICVDGPCNYTLGITNSWVGEIALDVEWAHAMAPGATINLYIGSSNAQPLYDAVAAAVAGTNGTSPYSPSSIVSMSWGSPENDIGESGAVAPVFGENYPWLNQVFQLGASEGITFFSSTGDSGGYFQGGPTFQSSPYGGANYPASDPFVTAVGGTSLYMDTTSGYLAFPAANATGSYGYETAWSYNNLYSWGTGGGFSTFFGQPAWQKGLGVPAGETRGVPDVSWDADVLTGVLVYVSGGFYIYGGTSVGSPSWSGAMALIDQAAGHGLGLITPSLYSILNNPSEYAKTFHDVTVGDDDPYQAHAGWDPVTGIGTPNIGELAYYLSQPSNSLVVSASSNVHSLLGMTASYTSVQINATVTSGGSPVITGSAQAAITSAAGVLLGDIPMTYDSVQGIWVGTYNVQPTDPPGMWTATVSVTSGSQSGTGTTTFSVGDGVTIFAIWGDFVVGQTIPIAAAINSPDGSFVTSGSFTATFYLGTPSGPVQGSVPLFYNATAFLWEGSFPITSSVSQGSWVMAINGTDSNGNQAAVAYSWVNVGLVATTVTDSDTYVLGNTITVGALIHYYTLYNASAGSFIATFWHNGKDLGSTPLSYNPHYGLWIGTFWSGAFISSSNPAGFYRVVVTGNDGSGNSAYGETLIRIATQNLSVASTITSSKVLGNTSATETVTAKITYPNNVLVTAGSVDAFTSNGYFVPLTYQAASNEFVGVVLSGEMPAHAGIYAIEVVAFDPWGNVGAGLNFFSVATSSATTLTCSSPVKAGSPSTCTASVSGYKPTGSVSFLASGSGKFSPGSCTLSAGSCLVTYVPTKAAGTPQTITAAYAGDQYNFGSSGTSSIIVNRATSKTSVACTSSAISIGTKATCTVTVTGDSPTGTVSWSQSGTGAVSFNHPSCNLSASYQCQVVVTGTKVGPLTLKATYSGDTNNVGSYNTFKMSISKAATTLSLSCKPSENGWTCTATLKGYYGSINSEKITWSKASGTGKVSFSPSSCALSSKGTCSVTVKGTKAGTATIEAAYSGDTNNTGSQGTAKLTIKS